MTLLIVSFIAGLLTALAPCILPLLPVIIGGSLAGKPSRARALRITLALSASVFLFTLLLKVSTALVAVPPQVWQFISGGILFGVGLFMLFPVIWERLVPAGAAIGANKLMSKGAVKGTVWGDIIVGAALGPVFSSCSPTYFILLAAVLPAHPLAGILYLLAYIGGLGLSLFAIGLLGQKIVNKLNLAADPRGWFKRIIGLLFMLLGLAIIFGFDKTLQTHLPAGAFGIAEVEQKILALTNPNRASMGMDTQMPSTFLTPGEKALRYPRATELAKADAYLNTGGEPITIAGYKGKNVVLVDFWTYSCINCLRTVPYLTSWYGKYKDQGLVIIGVHTPEFAFEHVQKNVEDALKRLGIEYPVVLDNEYQTWNAYQNQYWPHEYLIDIDGYVVHEHIGEGGYDETEAAIQQALAERAERLGTDMGGIATSTVDIADPNLRAVSSPETYFGAKRNEYLGNGPTYTAGVRDFTLPAGPGNANTLYLGGSWNIEPEFATSEGENIIRFTYSAHDVYFVASADSAVSIEVWRDGKLVGSAAGSDVDPKTGMATISAERLYTLIHDATPGTHTLELHVHGVGLHAYTFTFG